MSPGAVPLPPAPRPTKRSEVVSSVVNCNMPFPLICCWDTALPSGQPLHPPLLVNVAPLAVTLTRLIHVALPVDGVVGVGVVGAGVVGVGVTGAGVVGAGVVGVGDGEGAPGDTPSLA